jgi:hypothetical protein
MGGKTPFNTDDTTPFHTTAANTKLDGPTQLDTAGTVVQWFDALYSRFSLNGIDFGFRRIVEWRSDIITIPFRENLLYGKSSRSGPAQTQASSSIDRAPTDRAPTDRPRGRCMGGAV